MLKAVQPGVDTRLTPTASQVTDHIERLLNRGDNATALDMIEKRLAETKGQRGTDVTDVPARARPGRPCTARRRPSTSHRDDHQLPRIAGTLNNLAALYAGRGELEKRRTPCKWRCAPIRLRARANLGDLQLLQALRTYKQAASDGVPGMQDKAREVETMLKENKANDVELFSPAPAAPDGCAFTLAAVAPALASAAPAASPPPLKARNP